MLKGVSSIISASNVTGITSGGLPSTGSIGEFQTAQLTSGTAASITSGTSINVVSKVLTAGEWDVWGVCDFVMTGLTSTLLVAGVSSTSATIGPQDTFDQSDLPTTGLGGTNIMPTPLVRFSFSGGGGTVYLVATATFSVGTLTAYGTINARRVG